MEPMERLPVGRKSFASECTRWRLFGEACLTANELLPITHKGMAGTLRALYNLACEEWAAANQAANARVEQGYMTFDDGVRDEH